MKKSLRVIMGIILMPVLYARYSFVFFLLLLPRASSEYDYPSVFSFCLMWIIYVIIFNLIMGHGDLINKLLKLIQKVFAIEYTLDGRWNRSDTYSFSHWHYPVLRVRDKKYNLRIAVMGGNTYTKESNILRKAIVYWMFY